MLSDAKARKLKPNDKAVSDGTIVGLYLVPGGNPGSGKWILRFPFTGYRQKRVEKWDLEAIPRLPFGTRERKPLRRAPSSMMETIRWNCAANRARRSRDLQRSRPSPMPHVNITPTRPKASATRNIAINGSARSKGSSFRRLARRALTNSARRLCRLSQTDLADETGDRLPRQAALRCRHELGCGERFHCSQPGRRR